MVWERAAEDSTTSTKFDQMKKWSTNAVMLFGGAVKKIVTMDGKIAQWKLNEDKCKSEIEHLHQDTFKIRTYIATRLLKYYQGALGIGGALNP